MGLVALLPAIVVLLFAVEPVAEPLPPGIATTGFDGRGAAATARQIESLGEERERGSQADIGAADLIAERFGAIPAGSLLRIPLSEGGIEPGPPSEIVTVTLPGESAEAILVLAPRTAASAPDRLATATASGVLTQLAASFGDARHQSTLIFASVPAAGSAAELARLIATERPVAASFSIDDARGVPTADVLLHRAPGDLIASSTLAETARAVIGGEGVPAPTADPPLAQIARLGIGISFGTQARMLSEQIDAVALAATGELPPSEGDGAPSRVVSASVETVGQIALRVVQAIDAAPALPDEEGSYVRFGDNVVPGWAFGLLALALVIPALLTAVDALARAARRERRPARALQSVVLRGLPFFAAAVLLYLLSGVGIVPDPGFPFDPGGFELGASEALALSALALCALAVAVVLRVDSVPAAYGGPTLAAAAGLVICLCVLGIWLANPFAALLVVPLAHVWTLAARERATNPVLILGLLVLTLVPLAAALAHVADELDLGADTPWTITMLISGGQLRAAQVLIACALGGALLAVLAASRSGAAR